MPRKDVRPDVESWIRYMRRWMELEREAQSGQPQVQVKLLEKELAELERRISPRIAAESPAATTVDAGTPTQAGTSPSEPRPTRGRTRTQKPAGGAA